MQMETEQQLVIEASKIVGSQAKLSKLTGIASTFLNQMAKGRRPVPDRACVRIEKATDGIVSRKRFRPHNYVEIWPELADPPKTDTTLPTR